MASQHGSATQLPPVADLSTGAAGATWQVAGGGAFAAASGRGLSASIGVDAGTAAAMSGGCGSSGGVAGGALLALPVLVAAVVLRRAGRTRVRRGG